MKRCNAHYDLMTEAGAKNTDNVWKQYPRPHMTREGYKILDADWTLNGQSIRVPFVPQSILSDYQGRIGKHLCYETTFELPASFLKERILLHFGAVDQIAEVWVNDSCVGVHEGGYTAFSFDITEAVKRNGTNKLVVKVTDKLSKKYPYGKQRKKRGGMWYTPISGIWQAVWLENVPSEYIEGIELKPDLQGVNIRMYMKSQGFHVSVMLENGEVIEKDFAGTEGYLYMDDYICADGQHYKPRFWTPEHPHLYSMKLTTKFDEIETYFALRTISVQGKDGVPCVCLNGEPIFFHGILDQGYFSDGIYLPAEPEEYERDIMRMKELGFNMLRKHIKVEPEYFYYYCDKHGMLVMQDMVNNGAYSFLFDTALPTIGMKKRGDKVLFYTKRKRIFKEQTEQTIRQLYNHPCIVAYTIFNEGWGQFDSDEMYRFVKGLDDSRLIDSTSGWFWQKESDFDSEHIYFRTKELKVGVRPLFVSECGGFSRAVEGHMYSKYKSYGYGTAEGEEQLTEMIENMYRKMILPGISKGVCGCIYTQLSDVEDEINGIYTYDRKVCKVNKQVMQKLAKEFTIYSLTTPMQK